MSFLRNVPKNQLKRSVSCVCFCRCVWQNSINIAIGIKYQPLYRKLHHTSYLAKSTSDYYKALGVSRRATAQEIKDAYYELSKRYHPDKNRDSDMALERFREIKEAYEVLGNHGKKRKYDRVISPSGGGFTQQVKTERTGNEIVVQDTDAYAKHMARYSTPMGNRPTAHAIDKNLSDQNSEIFREKQKLLSQKIELEHEMEDNEKSSKNTEILFFGMFIIAVIAIFFQQINEKRYEKILRENKENKSK